MVANRAEFKISGPLLPASKRHLVFGHVQKLNLNEVLPAAWTSDSLLRVQQSDAHKRNSQSSERDHTVRNHTYTLRDALPVSHALCDLSAHICFSDTGFKETSSLASKMLNISAVMIFQVTVKQKCVVLLLAQRSLWLATGSGPQWRLVSPRLCTSCHSYGKRKKK